MIRRRSGDGRRGLDDVQAIHRGRRTVELAATSKLFRVGDVSWSTAEKIGIQRDDYVRFFDLIDGVDVASESQERAIASAVARGRFPLIPLSLRDRSSEGREFEKQAWEK